MKYNSETGRLDPVHKLRAMFISMIPAHARTNEDLATINEYVLSVTSGNNHDMQNPMIEKYLAAAPEDNVFYDALPIINRFDFLLLGYKLFTAYNVVNGIFKISDVGYTVSVTSGITTKDAIIANIITKLAVQLGLPVPLQEDGTYFIFSNNDEVMPIVQQGLEGGAQIGNLDSLDFEVNQTNVDSSVDWSEVDFDDEYDIAEADDENFVDFVEPDAEDGSVTSTLLLSAESQYANQIRADLGLPPLTEEETEAIVNADSVDEGRTIIKDSTTAQQNLKFESMTLDKWKKYPFTHPMFDITITFKQYLMLVGETMTKFADVNAFNDMSLYI